MLPKISAALSKFVTPIQTTSAGSSAHEKEFVRTQPLPKAKVLPFKNKSDKERPPSEDRSPESEDQSPGTDGSQKVGTTFCPASELGASFLQLFAMLRHNSGAVFKWIGVRGYQVGMRATRRGGRLRKGAMLDVKVE